MDICRFVPVALALLIPLRADAQQAIISTTESASLYPALSITSDAPASDEIRNFRDELELTFSTATDPLLTRIEFVSRSGTWLAQSSTESARNKMIPLQVMSSIPDDREAGFTELMDGLVIANSGTRAFLLAPVAWDRVALVEGLVRWGSVSQTNDGRLEISNPNLEPSLHFSATFTFRGVTQTSNTGALALMPPAIRNSNSSDHFYVLRYPDGIEEILQPIVADPQLMNALAALQVSAEFNRNLGVLTIADKTYRPSYFVEALRAETEAFLDANADDFEVAFRPDDVNDDGLMDYQIISPLGSQWLYGQF